MISEYNYYWIEVHNQINMEISHKKFYEFYKKLKFINF